MTTDDIKRDIESGALTSPIIVFERMLKAKLNWPSDEELDAEKTLNSPTHSTAKNIFYHEIGWEQCSDWLRKRLMGEGKG
jgi:hypothetical protein